MQGERKKKGIPFVISGPSGSGKGTIVKEILKKNSKDFVLSVSATTRNPRPGETDGVEYYFITREEFEQRIAANEVLEHTCYCGNYYGTLKSEVESRTESGLNVILEIEIEGGMNVRRICPGAVLFFVIPPDARTLENRLRGRGTDSEEVIRKRLDRAQEEMKLAKDYDYLIINESGSPDVAADTIMKILEAEQNRLSRNSEMVSDFFEGRN